MPTPPPPKPCVVCGREITWRKKWERDWEQVKYCSEACRRGAGRVSGVGAECERVILELLARRPRGATICPSEVARALFPNDWRTQMEEVRQAGRRLVVRGQIVVMQEGKVVDAGRARGPIRFRLIGG